MEVVREKPLLILDGSHNPYAIGKVVREIDRIFPGINFLFTGLTGKEWQLSMEVIRRYRDSIYLVQVNHHRGEPIANLYRYARDLGFKDIRVLDSPAQAWQIGEDLCAVGSLYLVGEIKEALSKTVI
jgi:dihydrofolate synthase/folylpolyglutamate synthase